MTTDRDRKGPPVPSAYALGEEEPNDPSRRRRPAAEEEFNAHLNLDRIEGRMNESVARQVIKMMRDNPELAANVVKGWTRGK